VPYSTPATQDRAGIARGITATMGPLSDCCQQESQRSLAKHRRVARCDGCNSLLMSYGDRADYDRTIAELADNGVKFQVGSRGKLLIIAYRR
jgi:hypothetical protein